MNRSGLELHVAGVQNLIEATPERDGYNQRNEVRSKSYLTMLRREDTDWVISRIRERIAGRVVVEVGAGIGVLALETAKVARRVFAVESDIAWSWMFARHLYTAKPDNLTWIMDRAQNMVDVIRADVAIVVTGSDAEGMRAVAGQLAPEVILPWQDFDVIALEDHAAVGGAGTSCRCLFGCVVDGAQGMPLVPGESCHLRSIGVRP